MRFEQLRGAVSQSSDGHQIDERHERQTEPQEGILAEQRSELVAQDHAEGMGDQEADGFQVKQECGHRCNAENDPRHGQPNKGFLFAGNLSQIEVGCLCVLFFHVLFWFLVYGQLLVRRFAHWALRVGGATISTSRMSAPSSSFALEAFTRRYP